MLVKVRNDDPSRLSSTERTVVNWLKSWSGPHAVPGIAIVQCQDADIVVWTPQTSVVVGVHGFTERVTGTLSCSQDEPWTVDGKPAPIDGDANPLERVRQQTEELARQLRSAPGRESVPVSGLVLLVPQLGSRVKLEKGSLPPGIDVLIGDGPSSLRAYFTKIAEGADPSWDAAQVGQALGALGFAAAATYSDLVSEGFPPPESARTSPPPMSAAQTVVVPSVPVSSAEPPRPVAAPRGAAPVAGSASGSGNTPGDPQAKGSTRDNPGAQQVPPESSGKSSSGKPSAGAVAAAGAGAAAAAAAAYRALTGGSSPAERHDPQGGTPHAQSGSPQGQGQAPNAPLPPQQPNRPGGQPNQPPNPLPVPGPGPAASFGAGAAAGMGAGAAAGMGAGRGPGGTAMGPGAGADPSARMGAGPTPESHPQASYSAAPSRPAAPGFPIWQNQQQDPRQQRPAKDPKRRRGLGILAALALVFIILFVAAMCSFASTGTSNEETRTTVPAPGERVTTSVREPTRSTKVDPTIPKTTVPPACFPLDPNC